MSIILEAIDLSKTYHQHHALNKLNLCVRAGEIYCLLGQNGAGKTTTINLFLGLIDPTEGVARINNIEVHEKPEVARAHLAYIPEVVQLYGNLSAVENLDFFSRLAGIRHSGPQLTDLLHRAGLQSEAHHKHLKLYSKGMRQKVGIAIALAKNAKAILMDEPTSGLDPKASAEFTQLCKELASEGRAILMATHDIFGAVNLGTTIGIMRQGQLVHQLPTSQITADGLQQLYMETI
ncbi:ABC transporter ATP-binding protein [Pedobacter deserti]|uniref:ABC transporter ATP-binding protein n=1 Tax=Pedobacter deserti TaxID=2817382 RepID=UPI00210B4F75|nr:ABC transporter ATP-binding protein [Pedobacter sp. SYSU D00382]